MNRILNRILKRVFLDSWRNQDATSGTHAARGLSQDGHRLDGLMLTLQKAVPHRWDRLAQNHSLVKNFLRKESWTERMLSFSRSPEILSKDWVQDDGDMEEEQERAAAWSTSKPNGVPPSDQQSGGRATEFHGPPPNKFASKAYPSLRPTQYDLTKIITNQLHNSYAYSNVLNSSYALREEDIELPSGTNVKRVSGSGLSRLLERHSLVVVAPRFPWCEARPNATSQCFRRNRSCLFGASKLSPAFGTSRTSGQVQGEGSRVCQSCQKQPRTRPP